MHKPEDHLNLVQSVLNVYYGGGHNVAKRMGIDPADLFQIGCIGLIKATRDYDPLHQTQASFVTYAFIKIQGELMRFIRDDHYFGKYPRHIRDYALAARKLDSITPDSLSVYFQIDMPTATELYHYMNRDGLSLFEPLPQAGETPLSRIDVMAAEEETTEDKALRNIELEERLSLLNEHQYKVCALLLKQHTQSQVASQLNLSQAQVSRLLRQAVLKINNEYVVNY